MQMQELLFQSVLLLLRAAADWGAVLLAEDWEESLAEERQSVSFPNEAQDAKKGENYRRDRKEAKAASVYVLSFPFQRKLRKLQKRMARIRLPLDSKQNPH